MALRPESRRSRVTAGKRDRVIAIQRRTVTVDGYGGEVETWSTVAQVWASATPTADSERFEAGGTAAHISHRFVTGWLELTPALDPAAYRILYEERAHNIVGVKELGRREGYEISAIARAEAPAEDEGS